LPGPPGVTVAVHSLLHKRGPPESSTAPYYQPPCFPPDPGCPEPTWPVTPTTDSKVDTPRSRAWVGSSTTRRTTARSPWVRPSNAGRTRPSGPAALSTQRPVRRGQISSRSDSRFPPPSTYRALRKASKPFRKTPRSCVPLARPVNKTAMAGEAEGRRARDNTINEPAHPGHESPFSSPSSCFANVGAERGRRPRADQTKPPREAFLSL